MIYDMQRDMKRWHFQVFCKSEFRIQDMDQWAKKIIKKLPYIYISYIIKKWKNAWLLDQQDLRTKVLILVQFY